MLNNWWVLPALSYFVFLAVVTRYGKWATVGRKNFPSVHRCFRSDDSMVAMGPRLSHGSDQRNNPLVLHRRRESPGQDLAGSIGWVKRNYA